MRSRRRSPPPRWCRARSRGSRSWCSGCLGTPLLIGAIGEWRARARGSRSPLWVAGLIAFGIGLHNLGEGLAIGTSYATGEIALGTFLVIGFLLHNTTEGLGIVTPLAGERPRARTLLLLGALAGVPTVIGAWIGGFTYSPIWTTLFFAVGAGAIVMVVYELWRLFARRSPGGPPRAAQRGRGAGGDAGDVRDGPAGDRVRAASLGVSAVRPRPGASGCGPVRGLPSPTTASWSKRPTTRRPAWSSTSALSPGSNGGSSVGAGLHPGMAAGWHAPSVELHGAASRLRREWARGSATCRSTIATSSWATESRRFTWRLASPFSCPPGSESAGRGTGTLGFDVGLPVSYVLSDALRHPLEREPRHGRGLRGRPMFPSQGASSGGCAGAST